MPNLESILFSPISSQIRLKPETEKALKRLTIHNVRDIILHIPHNYQSVKLMPKEKDVKEGDRIITEGIIKRIEKPSHKRSPTKIYIETNLGLISLVFFSKIPIFIYNKLRIEGNITVEGTLSLNDFHYQITHPDFIFNPRESKEIEPIYPLTYALNNKQLTNYIKKIFNTIEGIDLEEDLFFAKIFDTLKKIHFPNNQNEIDNVSKHIQILAKYELLSNQINLAKIRSKIKIADGRSFKKQNEMQIKILSHLGFTPTDSQSKVLEEIEKDQNSPSRMVRMLQGDVGSGKTLVALLSIINVLSQNMQSVLMAPTEILAIQHYNFFKKALGDDERIALLTGKTKNKKAFIEKLAKGEILILIGTHAIFQEKVTFKNLAYIVIDEQHKFGVGQRLDLISKAENPDLLVMTATPIPRSLTLTMFGDMASSKLIGKPKGRLPIITNVMSKTRIDEMIEAIKRKIDIDEKIYWICPMIEKMGEDDDNQHLMDVTARASHLEQIYPNMVGIIHGKMKNEEKDQIMLQFKEGNLKILVATTVIEVGIDVPDATLIIIENAEKFGLSSLHQLRGRVGRSNLQSHSLLLYAPERTSKIARERMKIMKDSEDGFYIAEQDLILRGGGEILGTKQSGEQRFIFADLSTDLEILLESNKKANILIEQGDLDKYELLLKLFQKTTISTLSS